MKITHTWKSHHWKKSFLSLWDDPAVGCEPVTLLWRLAHSSQHKPEYRIYRTMERKEGTDLLTLVFHRCVKLLSCNHLRLPVMDEGRRTGAGWGKQRRDVRRPSGRVQSWSQSRFILARKRGNGLAMENNPPTYWLIHWGLISVKIWQKTKQNTETTFEVSVGVCTGNVLGEQFIGHGWH